VAHQAQLAAARKLGRIDEDGGMVVVFARGAVGRLEPGN